MTTRAPQAQGASGLMFDQNAPLDHVGVVKLDAAFRNTPLTAVASVLSEPIAANVSSTNSKAYSVKSWPCSSFHSPSRKFFIFALSLQVDSGRGIMTGSPSVPAC